MKYVYNSLKNYLINHPEFFTAENLAPLEEKNFNFGVVDLLKNKNSLIVAIVPQSENEYDDNDDLTVYLKQSEIVVSFISRNNKQSILDDNTIKYAAAFRKAVITDSLLDSSVYGSQIGERNFYLNCGTTEMQMSAVDIDLSVVTE